MTRQDAFDTAWRALRAQGRPGGFIDEGSQRFRCEYSAPDGARCAIGLLLSEEAAQALRGCESIQCIVTSGEGAEHLPAFIRVDWEFYEDLQAAHDGAALFAANYDEDFISEARERFAIVAARYGLSNAALLP